MQTLSSRLAVAASAVAVLVAAAPSMSTAEEPAKVDIFQASAAAPPVSRVIGQVHARACRTDEAQDRAAAIDHLRQKASAMGATGVIDVELQVEKSQTLYIKNGFPNPCRYEAKATGTAVVLGAATSN